MVILKSLDLNRDKKTLQENYKPEFQLLIKKLPEKLHPGECKQSKSGKICATTRWEIECEKSSKCFCKIFGRQNMQNQINTKNSKNPEDIFKSAKNFLEKLNIKRTTLKLANLKL